MFGFGIRYLMGWAMASADGADKRRAEWPPHPDRVFMALAAGWFQTDQDPTEAAALRWVEKLSPPSIYASSAELRHEHGGERPTVSYVPVNDIRRQLGLLPGFRSRQRRSFPIAIPHEPVVYLSWDHELPDSYRKSLEALCSKVCSIGHSASLVQMWLTVAPPPANLVPVSGRAKFRLRIAGPGRLAYLENRYNREAFLKWVETNSRIQEARGARKMAEQEELRQAFPNGRPVSSRPEPGLWQGYDKPVLHRPKSMLGSLFDPNMIALSLSGRRLFLSSTLKLTEALRGALLDSCCQPIPEWISGHAMDGSRTSKPHLAILPMPFVGSAHADGRLLGVALAIPRDVAPSESSRILEPLLRGESGTPRKIRLFDGHWLECIAELETRESPPLNLRPTMWTGPASTWSTVTPVVLDQHFDGKDKWERAAESIKTACERIGLPRPTQVFLHPVSMIEGVLRSNEFPCMTRKKDGGRIHHSHAVIFFEQDVEGPVLIGAGRFRGYGLCRPLAKGGENHA